MKSCTKCQQQKPLSEFYKKRKTRDGRDNTCKDCKREYQRQRIKKGLHKVKRTSESGFVKYLHQYGIPASTGRDFKNFAWADVVAWGCIPIELKTAFQTDDQYTFYFTPRQQELGITAKLIVLGTKTDAGTTYHFFDPSYPAFYKGGQLKKAIVYNTNSLWHKSDGKTLTDAIMAFAANNMGLIQTKLNKHIQSLISVNYQLEVADADGNIKQLSLTTI